MLYHETTFNTFVLVRLIPAESDQQCQAAVANDMLTFLHEMQVTLSGVHLVHAANIERLLEKAHDATESPLAQYNCRT